MAVPYSYLVNFKFESIDTQDSATLDLQNKVEKFVKWIFETLNETTETQKNKKNT